MTDTDTILRLVADGLPCSEAQGARIRAIHEVDKDLARQIVRAALVAQDGNRAAAAKQLSIGRRTLWRWIREDGWDSIGVGLKNAKLGRVVE